MNYISEPSIVLNCDSVNFIRERRTYYLPILSQDFAVVELAILCGNVCIESQHAAIRHGDHFGTRIFLGSSYGKIDLNPKFLWNGKEWLINTHGTFIFSEIEINAPERTCEKD